MNIAVIGCAGFIGATLSQYLVEAGHTVHGYSHCPRPSTSRILWRQCDICTTAPDFPRGLDAVFYLSQSPFYREFPQKTDHLFAVNSLGALRAAQAATQSGVRFFCFASTGNVYASSFEPRSEEHPLQRNTPYALSKIHAEESLDLFCGAMQVTSIRLFGIFGPGQRAMIPYILRNRIANDENIYLEQGPGEDMDGLRVSFLYLVDLCRILLGLVEMTASSEALPMRLNVAGPEGVSLRHFAEAIGRTLGRAPRLVVTERHRTFDLVADISRLQALQNPCFTPLDAAVAASFGSLTT